MQAAVVEALDQPLVLQELHTPTPGPGQILVKPKACGVCHPVSFRSLFHV